VVQSSRPGGDGSVLIRAILPFGPGSRQIGRNWNTSANQPELMFGRSLGQPILDRSVAIGLHRLNFVIFAHAHQREVLGQHNNACARGRGERDQSAGFF
jgi:hypothetical protein